MTVTLNLGTLLTWPVGLILFAVAVLALFGGSLPDNSSRPVGDFFRVLSWPLLAIWIIAMVIKACVT